MNGCKTNKNIKNNFKSFQKIKNLIIWFMNVVKRKKLLKKIKGDKKRKSFVR